MSGARDPSVAPLDGTCHLYRLSGELRNVIYEYALSEPNGLLYREDKNGAGHLCLPSSDGVVEQEQPSEESPRKSHKRRKISGDEGIPVNSVKTIQKLTKASMLDELNQLQYVNREISLETKGLEIRYNDVIFEDFPENVFSAQLHCKTFLRRCTITQHSHLRQLTLYNNIDGEEKVKNEDQKQNTWKLFADFCDQNPQAKLKVHVRGLKQNDPNFLLQALIHMCAYKRSNWTDFAKRLTHGDAALEVRLVALASELVGEKKDRNVKIPDNWIFFPVEKTFDEAVFRNVYESNVEHAELVEMTAESGLDAWVELARGLYENGF